MNLSEFKKSRKSIIIIVLGLFVAISVQFTTAEVKNPPVTGEFQGPEEVKAIFKRACYDCHSNETKLAWYDKIAPVSWMVSADVVEARKRFNLSEWDKISDADRENLLWEMLNKIDQGQMPLKSYVFAHPSARVLKEEIEVLKSYVNTLPGTKKTDTTKIIIKKELVAAEKVSPDPTPVALNGIRYSDEYKKWKVIATTNRFDNGTMRLIYGNDITVKAIEEGNINPWPNGAKIAKVVWNKQPEDKDGNVKPGNFNNVQYMIKDDQKYKDTEGWGFARFTSLKLLPYGKTADYGKSCINCHRMVAKNGFVFDIPTKLKSQL